MFRKLLPKFRISGQTNLELRPLKNEFYCQLSAFQRAHTHCGYGIDHAVGDLILSHVLHHIKLSCSLLGDDLVSDFLQLRVELLKQIFEQQRQELEKDKRTSPSSLKTRC